MRQNDGLRGFIVDSFEQLTLRMITAERKGIDLDFTKHFLLIKSEKKHWKLKKQGKILIFYIFTKQFRYVMLNTLKLLNVTKIIVQFIK